MSYDPITSFRRPVESVRLTRRLTAHRTPPETDANETSVDKWQILRDLTTARASYGLSDRALSVLQALLSFHPERGLREGDLIVFPSNQSICERLNGMACSTMRRHLATLLDSGLVQRRDSPNGKRFMRHDRFGSEAFGFDLTPLLYRHLDIRHAAATVQAARDALDRQRRTVSLMRRDLTALADFGARTAPNMAEWSDLAETARLAARDLRRRNDAAALARLAADLSNALEIAKAALDPETVDPGTNAFKTEHHLQKSKEYTYDSNSVLIDGTPNSTQNMQRIKKDAVFSAPLAYVLSVCGELQSFIPDRIETWSDLVRSIQAIRPMIGISDTTWMEALEAMGHAAASVTVAAMLERYTEIRSPGAYLRNLSRKTTSGQFSPVGMLTTIARSRESGCAAPSDISSRA